MDHLEGASIRIALLVRMVQPSRNAEHDPSASSISCTWTMFAWCSLAAIRASSTNMFTERGSRARCGSSRLITTSFSNPAIPRVRAR